MIPTLTHQGGASVDTTLSRGGGSKSTAEESEEEEEGVHCNTHDRAVVSCVLRPNPRIQLNIRTMPRTHVTSPFVLL